MTYHMILLVIVLYNISLGLPIALTYYRTFDGSLFQYIKSHLFIVGNRLFFIALLKYTNPLLYC